MRHSGVQTDPTTETVDPARLAALLDGLSAEAILARAIGHELAGRIALVSSFGAESVVLLHMVAQINPATPVLFLDTGKQFHETQIYRRELTALLGLSDIRLLRPDPEQLAALDPGGDLHRTDGHRCCFVRRVASLERGLIPFDAWITGRKRSQSATRATLNIVERDRQGRVKLNPLAHWDGDRVDAYIAEHALPRHPLVARGFPSIGCAPCTTPVASGEHSRAGRWRDEARDECGIHVVDGRIQRIARDAVTH